MKLWYGLLFLDDNVWVLRSSRFLGKDLSDFGLHFKQMQDKEETQNKLSSRIKKL